MSLKPIFLGLLFSTSIGLIAGDSESIRDMRISLADGPWTEARQFQLRDEVFTGLYRIKGQFNLPTELAATEEVVLFVSVLGSFEAYWDGALIGRNGKVGANPETEVEGNLFKILPLTDDQAKAGSHELELRISNWNGAGKVRFYGAFVGPSDDLYQIKRGETVFFMSFVGFFCAVALFYLLFFLLVERHEAYLTLALLCVAISVLLTFEYLKFFLDYPYSFHFPRLQIIAALTALSGLLLIRFCLVRFGGPGRLAMICSVIGMTYYFVFEKGYDGKSFGIMFTALLVSGLVVFLAVRQSKKGALTVFIPLVICIIPSLFPGLRFMDTYFFLSFVLLILVLQVEMALHARNQGRAMRESQLRSVILKHELTKKHIQPHFILNTLTSVVEWIEENPLTGIRMIEALADEFRIFNGIIDVGLIPVSQELALCRAHLEVMSFTLDRTLELEVADLDQAEQIPPGIFHTLLENALTHGDLERPGPILSIRREQENHRTCFTITNPIRPGNGHPFQEGTGLAYVKARLEDSFPDKWRIEVGPQQASWQVKITLEAIRVD